jgi:colicin import membrane protein
VTQDEVFRAADQIAGRGEKPGPTAVRRLLGDRGGYTLISELLRSWEEQRQQRPAAPEVPVPEALAERGAALVGEVWRAAVAQAQEQAREVEQAAEARAAQAEAGQAEAVAEVQRLEQQAEALEQARDAATQRADELAAQLSAAQVQAQAHQVRADELERQAGEHRQQIEQQAEELRQARAQALEQARQLGELDALRRQVEQLQALLGQRQQGQG